MHHGNGILKSGLMILRRKIWASNFDIYGSEKTHGQYTLYTFITCLSRFSTFGNAIWSYKFGVEWEGKTRELTLFGSKSDKIKFGPY